MSLVFVWVIGHFSQIFVSFVVLYQISFNPILHGRLRGGGGGALSRMSNKFSESPSCKIELRGGTSYIDVFESSNRNLVLEIIGTKKTYCMKKPLFEKKNNSNDGLRRISTRRNHRRIRWRNLLRMRTFVCFDFTSEIFRLEKVGIVSTFS